MREVITNIFGSWAGSAPTVTYCEPASSGFIARPGYAISNLPYIFLGLYLLVFKRKQKYANLFGIIAVLIGLASFLYDSSFTLITQTIDLAVMFSFVVMLLVLNVSRVSSLDKKWLWTLAALLIAAYTLLILVLQGSSGRILFGVVVVLVVASEFYLSSKEESYSGKWFLLGLVTFIVGFLIWLLDANKILCDPSNLFNGRAVYHYITTFTIYALWRHYRSVGD